MSELIRKINAAAQIPVTVEISAVAYIRTLVWGASRDGRSAEAMMAAIIADRAGNADNLSEAFSAANTQAAIVGVPTADYIREVIRNSRVRVPGIDLAELPDDVLLGMFGVKPEPGQIDTSVFENGG